MIRKFLKKLILKEKASSADYVSHLRKLGVRIGADVWVYAPSHSVIDTTCPWLLQIGDHVQIAQGVVILTHDYSWYVLKNHPDSPGCILGAQSPVTIGNNVFIGMNAVITRGVTIGDNVIVGAGSVVTKDCESDSVYAGNPARKITSLSDYFQKRKTLQFSEAREMARAYRKTFGNFPPQEEFREYFFLFCSPEDAMTVPVFRHQMELGTGQEDSLDYLSAHAPIFNSYEAFLAACFREEASECV